MKHEKSKKLFVVFLGIAILFAGNAIANEKDTRITVNLNENDQQLFLIEMREVLGSIHRIMIALDGNDMPAVAKAAQQSQSRVKGKSKELLKKLPADFKVFSKSVRKGFMGIAKTAKSSGSKDKIISQLSVQLGRCIACHSIYRLP